MDLTIPFGSPYYFVFCAVLLFSRGMDFLSTWIATPNMRLEANPVAKWMGWKWGIPFNILLCALLAVWPLPAVVISTTSLLVAGRNFQHGWWMRAMGEEGYMGLVASIMARTPRRLFVFCLLGEALPAALIGAAVMWIGGHRLVLVAVGMGMVGYAAVVVFYTLLSLWRGRRR